MESSNSLSRPSVKFPMLMVTYKLTAPLSTKFFKLNKFLNDLALDLFLTNLEGLPCKCNYSPFADRLDKLSGKGS